MEAKNNAIFVGFPSWAQSLRSIAFWTGLFVTGYVAVLPMANTIAARNVILFGLLVSLGCFAWQSRLIHQEFSWGTPILLWVTYLIAFPLIAGDHLVAWESLVGQWGKGVLAMMAGTGAAIVFIRKKIGGAHGGSLYLGLAGGTAIVVHLLLSGWKGWVTGTIPWGYWGRETHHADLGYAAAQSVMLLSAAIASGKARGKYRLWAVAMILACVLSTVLAESRAGFVFCLMSGLFVYISAFHSRTDRQRLKLLVAVFGLLFVGSAFFSVSLKEDMRWRYMASEFAAGFYGNAIQIQCEGPSSIESRIRERYGAGDVARRVELGVEGGDGARVILARAGLELATENPWGLDGSREAYQKLLKQKCPSPTIKMAHTHNGWLDTMLALGWAGALLYLAVLVHFFMRGLAVLRGTNHSDEWALVLVALSAFWLIRGFTDSVFRDHMLEMQGFTLAFAAATLQLRQEAKERV